MEVLLKVWYKSPKHKFKNCIGYSLVLDKEDKALLMKSINDDDLDGVKPIIKNKLKIPVDKLKGINCLNGCVDNIENKVTVLCDIYVTDNHFRLLKIEKLLRDGK